MESISIYLTQAMRVVHISTYDIDGGAARAAFRLHESLRAAGQDSTMLVRTRHSGAGSVQQFESGNGSNALFGNFIQEHYLNQNRTPLSTTCFSLGWPGEDLCGHPLVLGADIIHLHWVSGFISPSSIEGLNRLGKPIVWTLHDQRAYTGGCHYTTGCNQFERGCKACPQLVADPCGLTTANLADQVQMLAALPITIIAPSRWMAQCARRSAVFTSARIEVVPYGIDTERFRATPQYDARASLVLPEDNFLLLFGVDNAGEKRKGVRELFRVLEACGTDEDFKRATARRKASLLCFGELGITPDLPIPIRSFGRVRSDELLNSLYSAADLFLHPSLEDNLPNMVLESMCCGTPVGAFNTGGVSDLIVQDRTGFLAPTGDLAGLTRIIVNGVENLESLRSMRPGCRHHVETHFTYGRHAQACLALYEDLLRQSTRNAHSRPRPQASVGEINPGIQFQRAFAPILKNILDARPQALVPPGTPLDTKADQMRHERFIRRVRRILKYAVKKSKPYPTVKAALDTELVILTNSSSWTFRAQLFVQRLLKAFNRVENKGCKPMNSDTGIRRSFRKSSGLRPSPQ